MEKTIHQGRNIKRFREMLGIKQDALAAEMGEDWDQVKISRLEAKEEVEAKILKQVSAVLKVPVEAIENMSDEQAVNIISNTFNSHDNASGLNVYPTFNINPMEKWLEALEEIKRLNAELLKVEREKNALLERMISNK